MNQVPPQLAREFTRAFGDTEGTFVVRSPGRVNLIGEHIDYCGLPVFPMAVNRAVWLMARPRPDAQVRVVNDDRSLGSREFEVGAKIPPFDTGDWGNYLKAAAQALYSRYDALHGMDAALCSTLPMASGLSSSSALLIAALLALLHANGHEVPGDLASLAMRAERYVGTKSGGMDQAIILGAEAGHAALVEFDPLILHQHPVPGTWRFVAAFSTVPAPKSGSAKGGYNNLTERAREALPLMLDHLGLPRTTSWTALTGMMPANELVEHGIAALPGHILPNFRHIVTENARVRAAVEAMEQGRIGDFGALMNASHQSLRDDLGVSTPDLDQAVDICRRAGAAGARLTGAGFGGSIVALCDSTRAAAVREALRTDYYQPRGAAGTADEHCFVAEPEAGAGVIDR